MIFEFRTNFLVKLPTEVLGKGIGLPKGHGRDEKVVWSGGIASCKEEVDRFAFIIQDDVEQRVIEGLLQQGINWVSGRGSPAGGCGI